MSLIGVDRGSSAIEFADREVVHVPAMASQIVRMLEPGQADAAVWRVDKTETRAPSGVLARSLSPTVLERFGDRDTCAVFVATADNEGLLRARPWSSPTQS